MLFSDTLLGYTFEIEFMAFPKFDNQDTAIILVYIIDRRGSASSVGTVEIFMNVYLTTPAEIVGLMK